MTHASLVTKCFVINKSNEILVLKRSLAAKIRPGGWDLPGGIVEDREDPNTAIVRELNEEIGISAITPKILYITTELSPAYIITFFYTVDWNDMPIVLSNEHLEYTWVNRTEFSNLGLPDKFVESSRRL